MKNWTSYNAFRTWLCCLCLLPGAAAAQSPRLQVEVAACAAPVWRHTPKLTIATGSTRGGAEIGVNWQTLGSRDWQRRHRYPLPGVSFLALDLGDGAHGAAFALLPHLRVPFLRGARGCAYFRLGSGIAWVARPYDAFDNPGQNALGSHINNVTQLRLSGAWRISPRTDLEGGAALTHLSNGGFSLPNYGVNLPGAFLAFHYRFRPLQASDFQHATVPPRPTRRWMGALWMGMALQEYGAFDGPRYPVWTGAAALARRLSPNNRALLGIDYEFNRAVYHWGLHTTEFADADEARAGATRLGVFAGDEFLFGPLGIQVQSGVYLGRSPLNRRVLSLWYNKLSIRLYLPGVAGSDVRPFAGIALKAHKAVAEYISFQTGFVF